MHIFAFLLVYFWVYKRLIVLMLSMLDIHSVKGKLEVYINWTKLKRKVICHRSHMMKRGDVFLHICYYCGLSICG